jgi:hypothetical protein
MWSLRRRRGTPEGGGAAAVAEPPRTFTGTDAELVQRIAALTEANRAQPSHETERELLTLRNALGVRYVDGARPNPQFPQPDAARLVTGTGAGLPEFVGADVTGAVLRAGILTHGCLLVRDLFGAERALALADQIDRAFTERDLHDEGQPHDGGYYTELVPDPRYGTEFARPWIKAGGGVLAVDSPMLCFEMLEMFREAGLPGLVGDYLGEPPMVSGQKTTLRKAAPDVPGAWHQDGKFMGPVRALNLWLALSRCGDEAPGLDIVPKRLDHFVTTETDEAAFNHMISQRQAEQAAGETGVLRPIFEPGDALFFDEMFLHKTGSDPSMPKPRYAIESWFFGGSAFPTEYAPIAV